MAVFPNVGLERFITSVKRVATGVVQWFNEGFAGYGWRIWERTPNRHRIEVDEAFVRRNLISFEQVFYHLRSVKGELVLSQGFGKVKSIVSDEEYFRITVEGDMLFTADDFIHYSNTSSDYVREYQAKIEFVQKIAGVSTIHIPSSEFEGQSTPEIGDDIVHIGNSTNTDRQSSMILRYMDSKPVIDIYKGVNSEDYESKLVHRFSEEGFIGKDKLAWTWNEVSQSFDITGTFKSLNVEDSLTVGGKTVVGN